MSESLKEQDPTVAFRLKKHIRDFYADKATPDSKQKLSDVFRGIVERAYESDIKREKKKAA